MRIRRRAAGARRSRSRAAIAARRLRQGGCWPMRCAPKAATKKPSRSNAGRSCNERLRRGSDALEGGHAFHVFGEREKVERGERGEAKLPARSQTRGVVEQRPEPAAHVEEPLGRVPAQILGELGVEAL